MLLILTKTKKLKINKQTNKSSEPHQTA